MQFKTCLFCKRSMDQFCYSIYDPGNQPYLNIMQLFGDVEENLRHGRCICHECLYLIRWIYFMKKILADALLDEDTGEYDKVIPAFNIFKVKMSQPIFILAGESEHEDEDSEIESHTQSSSNMSKGLSEYEYLNQGHPANGRRRSHSNNNWWPSKQSETNENVEVDDHSSSQSEDQRMNENRQKYSCSQQVCEHKCDTFDELRTHHKLHHLIDQNDLTIDNYEKELSELSKTEMSMQKSRRKKFRCLLTQCRRAFKTVESLAEHKVKEHDLMARFWCVECYNLKFTSRDDLNQHKLTFHANITERANEYPCKYCDKYFLEKNLLSAHQLKHHHLQFLDQNEEKHSRTIVKRQVCKPGAQNVNLQKDIQTDSGKQGLCSFKMRRQKDIGTRQRRQQDILFKRMRSKYPNFNATRVTPIEPMKVTHENGKEKEKILISLPPRKRRLYQAANEIMIQTPQVVQINENPAVSTLATTATVTADDPTNITNMTETQINEIPQVVSMNVSEKPNENEDLKDLVKSADIIETNLIESTKTTNIEEVKTTEQDKTVKPIEVVSITPEVPVEEKEIVLPKEIVIPSENQLPDTKIESDTQLPLKTYNCRKRKKPNVKVKTLMKKCSENVEKQADCEIQSLQNTTTLNESVENISNPPDSTVPPVISQIEGKDNDNCPGRLTMKISLKAIRESKRKKKLKGKKKSKTEVTPPNPLIKKPVNKHVNGTELLKNGPVDYSHASISESEYEARNEIILNKDEINMIIFGDTLIGNNVTVVNEQIIDSDANVSSTNPQIVLTDATTLETSAPVKKKAKTKARFGKKRKLKRQNTKSSDASLKVPDLNAVNLQECVAVADSQIEDTVEGQIGNIQLKDHLYAISAFNAFKHSK